jgi:succinate dehydrogenase / fumarate reductase cytochrome b subunit
MKWLLRGLTSSVGTKQLMALTGVALLLFVLAHMLGNLQVFAGQEAYNAYAAKLKSLGPVLWVMRGGLLAVFLLHVGCAVRLTRRNRAARPVPYAVVEPLRSTYASRTMVMSGLIVLAFVIYHLLHFTLGVTDPDAAHLVDEAGRHDVYSMFVLGFQSVPVALGYVGAMLLLGLHLAHGIQSLFQTIGWSAPRYRPLTTLAGRGLAALIVLGNVAMPLSVLFGAVRLPGGGA